MTSQKNLSSFVLSEKRKAERERKKAKKQKLKTKVKEIAAADQQRGSQSPRKEPVENGKVIFNKFDLIKDPLEAEKEKQKVTRRFDFFLVSCHFCRKRRVSKLVSKRRKSRKPDWNNWRRRILKRLKL